MIPQYPLIILHELAIRPWLLVLQVLVLVAVVMLIWLLLETRRMKGKIERILAQTSTPGNQDESSVDKEQAVAQEEAMSTDEAPVPDNPDDIWQPGRKISKMDRELLARIDAEIEANIQDSEYSIEALRAKLGISRSGLYKKLIYLTGRAPLEYLRIKRLQMGRAMLESGETSVSQIAWSVGFSPKQFSKYFKDEYGCLPSEYIHYLSD